MNSLQTNEILDNIQRSIGAGALEATFKKYSSNVGLRAICQLNFSDLDWGLEAGWPTGIRHDATPEGLQEITIASEANRLRTVFPRKDISAERKRELLIDMLEGMHYDEAQLVVFAKDKSLRELYPFLTKELCQKVGIV